ncbi:MULTISPECIES: hypothetical protein [Actinomycetaceae]|uniref:Uncharacterized protein n=1 Tax=Actinotignum sanguinis TaxID=1445614 RepID=A0ABT5V8E6_9ACTO|nr:MULTISPECIES: hypothetical protein [Actinotignum]MDE1552513.1 hypothetical protein [Actinotignum sanguinis]MDE1642023.1 hypothetical protein [Actinotignum sanguinis]MDE1657204.1 hypothetical protein [Actinotignum sanguinis]MDK6907414.1 hypothetical protein [Actinotignum timonense]MDK8352742.1 hypothetical protein [Actinotignum sanguinis]
MRITKKELLRLLEENPTPISRGILAGDTRHSLKSTTANVELAQRYLESRAWEEAAKHLIENGTNEAVVDFYFMLEQTRKQLERTIRAFVDLQSDYDKRRRLPRTAEELLADKETAITAIGNGVAR